jgi:hypothetical protein
MAKAVYVFGECSVAPIELKLAAHHRDGNHENNAPRNRAWVHDLCHRKHHGAEQLGKKRK